MKTSVIGLFDEVDDARRVLDQLVGSPLDLGAIQVVSGDPQLERRLRSESGLPHRNEVMAGLVAGALLGAVLGAIAAENAMIKAGLGTILSAAAGILIGVVVGGLVGASLGRLRLPEGQDEMVISALDEGATAIVVRTENVPTARAIRDLFQSAGSRTGPSTSHVGAPTASVPEHGADSVGSGPSVAASPAADDAPEKRDEASRFAPPWKRGSDDRSP